VRIALAYDAAYEPPAMVVPVSVSAPGGGGDAILTAMLLDTGADCTIVPERTAANLRLPRVGVIEVSGVTGAPTKHAIHAATLHIGTWEALVEVVAMGEHAILGRDLLAAFVVRLDGPRAAVTLSTTSRSSAAPRRKK
jgi:predicted aspartyl protease